MRLWTCACGAVALGMTMWYWQLPRSHHWELYPSELTDNTPDEQADSLALFLRYCGEITEMTYVCTGSWTIMDNVVDALHDEGYESATKYKTNDWWPWAWRCLISSEICSRNKWCSVAGQNIQRSEFEAITIAEYYLLKHQETKHKNNTGEFYKLNN